MWGLFKFFQKKKDRKKPIKPYRMPLYGKEATIETVVKCAEIRVKDNQWTYLGTVLAVSDGVVYFDNTGNPAPVDRPPYFLDFVLKHCFVFDDTPKKRMVAIDSDVIEGAPKVVENTDLLKISNILINIDSVRSKEKANLRLFLESANSTTKEEHEINPRKWGLIVGILNSDIGD